MQSDDTHMHSAPKKKRTVTCMTVEKWKKEDLANFASEDWLVYEIERSRSGEGKYCSLLRCKVCQEYENSIHNRKNFSRVWIGGSTNFKLTNVVDHAKSEAHKIAVSLFNKSKGKRDFSFLSEKRQHPLEFNLSAEKQEELKRKFDVAYFVAKEELPLSKYERIISLEQRHGVPHGKSYSNCLAAKDFLAFQAKEIRQDLCDSVRNSKFFSILFDGTTDNAVVEQEAVFVLYFNP